MKKINSKEINYKNLPSIIKIYDNGKGISKIIIINIYDLELIISFSSYNEAINFFDKQK